MNRRGVRFDETNYNDFYKLHSEENGGGWCYCMAWWLPTWTGWNNRTAEQNKILRDELCLVGEYDGYLLYLDDKPVGWCQVGLRDRLIKLVMQYNLAPDIDTWAISCIFIAKNYRRKGLASFMLEEILRDLKKRKVKRVEAFPKRGDKLCGDDLRTGPEAMFLNAGFHIVKDSPTRQVLAIRL